MDRWKGLIKPYIICLELFKKTKKGDLKANILLSFYWFVPLMPQFMTALGSHLIFLLGLVARKTFFGVSVKARLKPVSQATETSWKTDISLVASLDMILS